MSHLPRVLVYCDQLLPYSATFVRSQAEALQNTEAYYAGCRRVPGLSLPPEKTTVVNAGGVMGKAWESAFKLWGFAPPFMHQLNNIQPSVIHAHFGPDGVRALPLMRNLSIPLFVSFHGYDVTIKEAIARRSTLSHRTYLQRRTVLQQEASQFIAVSGFIRDKMLNQGFPADKLAVHYIGVDTETFSPDPRVQRDPIVLFTGRLVEKKGCTYLIQAMAQIQQTRPDVELVMIGDGPLRSELESQASVQLKRYRFLGVQSPEQVRGWMNRAQVFCVPSIIAESGDAEAFGIVFAEAQAMGLPVVSFASGGIPEAVAHGKTGFLAPEKNESVLADYLFQLLDNSTLWANVSQNGQAWVRQHFDLKKQTQKLEDLYLGCIEKSRYSISSSSQATAVIERQA
ncbi:MAG: glycosyltransferase [Cyanobacteria bacterium P01_A01_bin.37]